MLIDIIIFIFLNLKTYSTNKENKLLIFFLRLNVDLHSNFTIQKVNYYDDKLPINAWLLKSVNPVLIFIFAII